MGWGSDFTTNMTTDLEGIYDGNMAGPSRAMAIENIGIPIIPVSIVSEAITLIGTLRELSARLNLSPSGKVSIQRFKKIEFCDLLM